MRENSIRHRGISSTKFKCSRFDADRHLFREELIGEMLHGKWAKKKVVLIAAKAGQGKTAIAAQFAQQYDATLFWYQVQVVDSDPFFLASTVYQGMKESINLPACELYEEILKRGLTNSRSIKELADCLVSHLHDELKENLLIVFDDLHHIENSNLSIMFLLEIFENMTNAIKIIGNSRRVIKPLWKSIENIKEAGSIYDDDLRFDVSEIHKYFLNIHGVALSTDVVSSIYDVTNGWSMGLAVFSQSKKQLSGKIRDNNLFDSGKEKLIEYFSENLLKDMNASVAEDFLQVSLVEDVSEDILKDLWGNTELQSHIDVYANQGCFIEVFQEGESRTYRFHPLFQEVLQEIARSKLTTSCLGDVYKNIGDHYFDLGQSLLALKYYVEGGNYVESDQLLSVYGGQILSKNLHETMRCVISKIPEAEIIRCPWIALFYGIALFEIDPFDSIKFLKISSDEFSGLKNYVGEVLALSQMIYFNLVVDGNFKACSRILNKLIEIYPLVKDGLPDEANCQISNVIGSAICFIHSKKNMALDYVNYSLELAKSLKSKNFIAANRVVRSYIYAFCGDFYACFREAEESLCLVSDPAVTDFYKIYIKLFQVDLLNMTADFENFSYHKNFIEQTVQGDLMAEGLAAPFLLLWSIDIALAEGDLQRGWKLWEIALSQGGAGFGCHMHSQFLQYGAVFSALRGEKEKARELIDESMRLREIVGGRLFVAYNKIFSGAVYGLIGDRERANGYLELGLKIMKEIGEKAGIACAYMQIASLKNLSDEKSACLESVANWLNVMKSENHEHFYSWNPIQVSPLLKLAVENNIDRKYAQHLGRKRLNIYVGKDGDCFPILQINCMGGLKVHVKGESSIKIVEFTEVQRKLIGNLVSRNPPSVHIEEMQDILWEECQVEASRIRMDTLLSRLRGRIGKVLSVDAKKYLCLNAGILSLQNCEIDVFQIRELYKKGFKHYGKKEYWQAGNALRKVFGLWQGPFMVNTPLGGKGLALQADLFEIYIRSCEMLADVCFRGGDKEGFYEVSRKGFSENPSCVSLARNLYNWYAAEGMPVEAGRILERFRASLAEEEFLVEDIDDIMESFWN